MNTLIPYILPFGLTLYLYFLPKVLIRNYIELYIEKKFSKYCPDVYDEKYIKDRIYNIIGFVSFLSAYSSIAFTVVVDNEFSWTPVYRMGMAVYFLVFIYLIINYFSYALQLPRKLKLFETSVIFIAILAVGTNIFLR